jgi:hypothetical protein
VLRVLGQYPHPDAQQAYEQLYEDARLHVEHWKRGRLEPRSKAPYSSQVLCISLFGTLASRAPRQRDLILRAITDASGIVDAPFDGTGATIECEERSHYAILGEVGGGTPTALDVHITWPTGVLAVESKFCEPEFGPCYQPRATSKGNPIDADGNPLANCSGAYAEGSDRKATTAPLRVPCRLTVPDRGRRRRRYWDVAPALFDARCLTVPQDPCPFRDDTYQLMRNLAFVFAWAADAGEPRWYGFLVVHVRQSPHFETLKSHYEAFAKMLRTDVTSRIGRTTYEDVADILDLHGETQLAGWIRKRIKDGVAAHSAASA